MRIALATRPAVLAAAILVVALVVLLPLRLVLGVAGVGDEGLAARRVEGSVWAGRLVDARVGDAALGDLDARVAPLALVAGRARLLLDSRVDAPGRSVHGAVTTSRHAFGLDGMTADVAVGGLLAPLPVATLALDAVSVRFVDEACDTAEGRVRATLVGGGAAGMPTSLPLPASLSGTVRCDGKALLVPLASVGGGETAVLRVASDGRYRADFTLRAADPAIAGTLAAAGFVAGPGGWRLSVEGRL